MNIEELVQLPEPEGRGFDMRRKCNVRLHTADQLRAYGEAVAAAVAKRCADLCLAEFVDAAATGCADDRVYNLALEHAAAAIRREFGEVSNG